MRVPSTRTRIDLERAAGGGDAVRDVGEAGPSLTAAGSKPSPSSETVK